MQAYVLINCVSGQESRVISDFNELAEIVEINGIWGKYDIFLKISTEDPNGVEKMINRLRNHPDVKETYTMHVLYDQGGSIDQE